ncbi:MAG TPA: pilin, partial [Burkholderiales bacterium]|nr:pilin [Burkholderiales bacterium]
MKKQSGFTLIEVMVVVVIIGVLAVVAIRSINGYVVRAKVSEAVLALSSCRTVVGEVYMSADTLPAANTWGCEATNSSKYVETITTTGEGIIRVEVRNVGDLRVDFHTISLAPLDSAGALMTDVGRVSRWRCGAVADGTD